MQMGTVIRASFGAYAKAFGPLLGLALAGVVPKVLASIVGANAGIAVAVALSLFDLLAPVVLLILMFIISNAALQGRPAALGPAFEQLGQVLWRFLWWSFVVGAAIAGPVLIGIAGFASARSSDPVGLVIGIPLILAAGAASIWLLVRWSLAGLVVTLEPVGSIGPLGRSVQLVRGEFWRIVGISTALGAVGLPSVILTSLGTDMQTRQIVNPLVYWVGVAFGTLASPLGATGAVAIYRSLAAPNEGVTT